MTIKYDRIGVYVKHVFSLRILNISSEYEDRCLKVTTPMYLILRQRLRGTILTLLHTLS
jgi:hypothetical protein